MKRRFIIGVIAILLLITSKFFYDFLENNEYTWAYGVWSGVLFQMILSWDKCNKDKEQK